MVRHDLPAGDIESLFSTLFPLLTGRVFHSTSESGYQGIITEGAVLCGPNARITMQWPSGRPMFRSEECVSFWDLHNGSCTDLHQITRYQRFYRHNGGRTTYLLILKAAYHDALITISNAESKGWHGQYVPGLESGLHAPVPLEWFSDVVKLSLWEYRYRIPHTDG